MCLSSARLSVAQTFQSAVSPTFLSAAHTNPRMLRKSNVRRLEALR
jgi:hypothetical protein